VSKIELIRKGKSEKEASGDKLRHQFYIAKEARWSVLASETENIGEKIDRVCRVIERENPLISSQTESIDSKTSLGKD
jgi:hypothetical protein